MIKFILVLIHLISSHSLPFGQQVDYEEVKALGGACPSFDTCSSDRKVSDDNLYKYTCECKPSCNKYGTCCIDSPHNRMHLLNDIPSWPDTDEESCHFLMGSNELLVLKRKCKPNWQHNQEIKAMCEAPSYFATYEDPLAATPVTNPKTSTTYKNYFCVLCNDDDVDNLVFWDIEVTKYMPESKYEKEKKKFGGSMPPLTFNNVTKRWGIMGNVEKGPEVNSSSAEIGNEESDQKVFEIVYMFFKYPPSLSESIESCSPDLIIDCHPDWKDETVRRKCHSYMGMIYSEVTTAKGHTDFDRFRNIHCAVCNFAGNSSDLECFIEDSGSDEKRISLSWLLDVNLSSGDKVGEIGRCPPTQVYDPFFKKCRTMVCIKPGHKLKGHKCEPS